MSLKTWKEEFYPTDASSEMTAIEATEHSLLKWKGLLAVNMKKHAIEIIDSGVIEGDSGDGVSKEFFEIDSESCALCQSYMNYELPERCKMCPLFKTLTMRCDIFSGVFNEWFYRKDPKPMIKALKATLKRLKAEAK